MKSIKKKAVAFISILALVFSFSSFFPLHVFAMADTYSTISAGWNYSMAIKEDGSLWGWGRNSGGQLGDGTTDERDTPVHIMDDVVSVSAGFFHTLAIKSDGSLWGWGNNDMYSALGETVTGTQTTPIKLFDNVRSAVAGYDCSLVIMNDGTLWGAGDSSILHSYTGPDSTESNKGFYLMLTDVIDASASAYSAFAITSDGALWAAGDKSNPAMGFGKDATGWTKGFEKIFDEVVSVDTENGTGLAYGTTAIVRTDDSLWVCGGWMDSSADRYEPEKVMDDVKSVSVALGYMMILKNDGTVWQWGRRIGLKPREVETGVTASFDTPEQMLDDGVTVSAGTATADGTGHAMVVKSDGSLWIWGSGYFGEIGLGGHDAITTPQHLMDGVMLPTDRPTLMEAEELPPVNLSPPQYSRYGMAVTGGSVSAIASPGGALWVWGNGLGDEPNVIMEGTAYVSANSHILAIKPDGSLWGVGLNSFNQINNSTNTWISQPEQIITDIASVSAGSNYTMAVKLDGTLWGWGSNDYGQLGNGTTEAQSNPVQVLDGVTSVYAADYITLAIRSDNSLWAWGTGVALNGGNTQLTPTRIMDDVQMAGSSAQDLIMALKTDGTLWEWNQHTNNENELYPIITEPVMTMESVISFDVTGAPSIFVLKDDSTLWAWGKNYAGQIGNGSTNDVSASTPVQVLDNVASISMQFDTSIAMKKDGTVWQWGAIPPDFQPVLVPTQVEFDGSMAPASEMPQAQDEISQDGEGKSLLLPLLIGGAVVVVGIIVAVIVIVSSEKKKKRNSPPR